MRPTGLALSSAITIALAGLASGCGFAPTFEDAAEADRQVVLYLYPPAEYDLPVQVRTDITLQAGTYGVVPLYQGVTVTGRLLLPSVAEDGSVSTEPVFGSVTASDVAGLISYEAQLNLTESSFQMRVPAGNYDLAVDTGMTGMSVPPQWFDGVELQGQGQDTRDPKIELALDLDPGLPLEVTLSYTDGLPVSGARVYTLDASGRLSSTLISAQEGVYRLQVAHGTHTLWMGPDPQINPPLIHMPLGTIQDEDEAFASQHLTYALPTHRLTGRVTDNLTTAVPRVTVYASRLGTSDNPREGRYEAQALTDEQGNFTLQLPEGSYDLLFRPSGNEAAPLSGQRYPAQVVLNQDLKLPQDVALEPMAAVTLQVRAEDGSPVGGASLTLISDDQANPSPSSLSDENGQAELVLGLGDYLVEVIPPPGSELARDVSALSVTQGMDPAAEIILEQGFSMTLQFVTDNEPVPGLLVQAWEVVSSAGTTTQTRQLASAVTDESGNALLVLPQE